MPMNRAHFLLTMLAVAKVGRVGMKFGKRLKHAKFVKKIGTRIKTRRSNRRARNAAKKGSRIQGSVPKTAKTGNSLAASQFGHPYGASDGIKRWVAKDQNYAIVTRNLQVEALLNIPPQTTATGQEHFREKDRVNLHGIKLTWRLINNLADSLLTVNYAIVSPRSRGTGIAVDDWFRNNDTTLGRDFTIALNNMEMSTLPINPDLYTVFVHKRFKVAPSGDTVSPTRQFAIAYKNWMEIDHYLPIRRQIRFQDSAPTSQLYVCWWVDGYNNPGGTASITTTTGNPISLKAVVFYKDS